MGLFDIRCSLTSVATTWFARDEVFDRRRAADGRRADTCSMFLVVREDDRWRPWTPPISGTYDRYGRIELWPEDINPLTEWAGERLWSLYQRGRIETSWPEDLECARDATRVEAVLAHGAQTEFNAVDLRIDGRPTRACIVMDLFADAIERATARKPESLDDALFDWFGGEDSLGAELFVDAPNASLSQWQRYSALRRYADAQGGLRSIGEVALGALWSDDAVDVSLREAWERDEGPVRAVIEELEPQRCARWRARRAKAFSAEVARQQRAAVSERGEARAYRPSERYAVGEFIEHKSFGVGRVRTVLSATKVEVEFDGGARTLAMGVG
jgi:hypothetical protein